MLTAVQEPIVVEKILLAANNLPAFSPASQQAVKLVNTENVKIPNLAAAISADQTLTIDLLRIVNSSAFGLPRQITKVQEAISYAGPRSNSSFDLRCDREKDVWATSVSRNVAAFNH